MDVEIEPRALGGTVSAIASKSAAHRLLILAALAHGKTDVDCNATSKDIEATISCLEALGARIARTRLGFRVNPIPRTSEGDLLPTAIRDATLDCGESGSTLRFMLPTVAALACGASIEGHGRLAERPLSPLYEELESHGARLSPPGAFPLYVDGRLRGGRFSLGGNVSSQFASGILLAAPLLVGDVEVAVGEPVESRPYIDLTIRALETFGVEVNVRNETGAGGSSTVFSIRSGQPIVSPGTVEVEGDWSNAAFWLASGAISGAVGVDGVDPMSAQGDRACLAALGAFGARVSRRGSAAVVTSDRLRGRTVDVSDIPDLAAPLAAVAAFAKGRTRIVGAARLRLKESDRLETIRAALSAMGCTVEVHNDELIIDGAGALEGGVVDAANDHRIAMMAAICAAHAQGETTIHGAECVQKSYPSFFEDFRALGGVARESEA
ncbi:MAG: 3-phosphoshikimate 1-carboxyvinyltransferase [Olsenella sp.]|nr:3-phosphoshikimate 1-carboxyvinyltransferase [Olsenella sp.]